MRRPRYPLLIAAAMACLPFAPWIAGATAPAVAKDADLEPLRAWVSAMKTAPRGPFERIRWFCNDGTVLPPKAFACRDHGGGRQHGERNRQAQEIRAAGFAIANVLAEISPEAVLESSEELLQQLLLEQFLINVDDGWILRQARYYRGAFQAEAEARSGRRILRALLSDERWLADRLALIYEAARLLPHGAETVSLTKLRADAATLQDQDPDFASLRNKIHGRPDPGDAARVRAYASSVGRADLAEAYEALAVSIEQATDPALVLARIDAIRSEVSDPELDQLLTNISLTLAKQDNPMARLRASSLAAGSLRGLLPKLAKADDRLAAIDAGLALNRGVFTDAQAVGGRLAGATRHTLLAWLTDLARAWYGVGGLSEYEWAQFLATIENLRGEQLDLARYREELKALTRTATWAQRRLALHFETSIERLSRLEPMAAEYIPDRLRGSAMLTYSALLEALTADANRLAGVRHEFFGATVSIGLRSLNPGLARGLLLTSADYAQNTHPGVPKILVVPETLADLPPVAGILTEHEGNHLSHVQLLARNLGIPNVVVDRGLQAQLDAHRGRPVELASSPGGIVSLRAIAPAEFAATTQTRKPDSDVTIAVDLDKLELTASQPVSLKKLRRNDSGVRVGPKAAQLGELMSRYPGTVSSGLALPFGAFRDLLDQPFDTSGVSAFDWLSGQYAALAKIGDPARRDVQRNRVLAEIRAWILDVELNPEFVAGLKQQMTTEFGTDGTYGVFVRSDTNVEDLPGFTGAGLNLTVPNVVGFDNTLQAIRRVWASPFGERAFGWRQALMDRPEHLYAAVLLHQSVNSDKSGVLVTSNIETGSRQEITVVINEGVGGGVEGQSAETVLIDKETKAVVLQSSATAPRKRVLLPAGGSDLVPVSGAEQLLTAAEINILAELVADIESWMQLDGLPQVADVEFGFFNNRLVLFQIRPFVENRAAASNERLLRMDQPLQSIGQGNVNLTQRPRYE